MGILSLLSLDGEAMALHVGNTWYATALTYELLNEEQQETVRQTAHTMYPNDGCNYLTTQGMTLEHWNKVERLSRLFMRTLGRLAPPPMAPPPSPAARLPAPAPAALQTTPRRPLPPGRSLSVSTQTVTTTVSVGTQVDQWDMVMRLPDYTQEPAPWYGWY